MPGKVQEFKDKTNFTSNEYLHINSCGKQNNFNKEYTILRTKGRVDYHILYIVSGSCMVEHDNEMKTLNAGDLILYKPGEKQLYTFSEPNTISYWVHFSGIGVHELLQRSFLLVKSIFSLGCDPKLISLFEDLIKEYTLKRNYYSLMCESKLIEIIATISRLSSSNKQAGFDKKTNMVYNVIEKMYEQNYNINMNELAEMCGLSKSRFDHLFKEVTGLAPYQYLLKIRLEKARYLIHNSTLNISEISDITGFSDPLYFSRIFKKYYKVSPKNYRKICSN